MPILRCRHQWSGERYTIWQPAITAHARLTLQTAERMLLRFAQPLLPATGLTSDGQAGLPDRLSSLPTVRWPVTIGPLTGKPVAVTPMVTTCSFSIRQTVPGTTGISR